MGERLELDEATEGYLHYNNVRVPLDHMLGEQGVVLRWLKRAWAAGECIMPCVSSGSASGPWT